jgi:hypothetical protein
MKKTRDVGPLPYKELMRMHALFEKDKRKHLKDHYKKEETKSVWFPNNDDFKTFLVELLNPTNYVSGLRVYVCQHDKDSVPPGVDPAHYIDKITIGFVATEYNEATGKHEDHHDAVNFKLIIVPPYDQGKICPPDVCP